MRDPSEQEKKLEWVYRARAHGLGGEVEEDEFVSLLKRKPRSDVIAT